VYSGQGSQWAGMGRQLLTDEPAFAAAVAELEPDFVAQTGFSLHDVLADGQPVTGIERIQPVLVGVQLALTALWRSYGVVPDAVIGHSMGEVSAAVVAGVLTPAEALTVITTRSRLLARLAGHGAMALLECDADTTQALLADYPEVGVAVYASPRQTVITGPLEQIEAVIAVVTADNRLARRIDVDVASHHHIVDPILPQIRTQLAALAPQAAQIPMFSTVDGIHDNPPCDADYWVANLRHPVQFAHAVTAASTTHTTFIEISRPGHPDPQHPRHNQLPHRTEHHPHHPPPHHRTPTRTPPPTTHHTLVSQPPLDHPQYDHPAGNTPAAGHRHDRSHQRHPDLAKHPVSRPSMAG
jgi:phthiocerol/phenolphthiocerol synthesis type-I polyketide synthase D